MFNQVRQGSFYAALFGYITLGIAGVLYNYLYLGFLIGLVAVPFIYISAFFVGFPLKILEQKFNASIWFWLFIYVFLGLAFSPIAQILIFSNNPFNPDSWVPEIYITYIPVGVMSAFGAWFGVVYKTHNQCQQQDC